MASARRALAASCLGVLCACSSEEQRGDDTAGAGGVPSPLGGGGTISAGNGGDPDIGGTAQAGGSGGGGSGGLAAGSPTAGSSTTAGGAGAGGVAFTLTSPALEQVTGCSVGAPNVCDVFPNENVSYMDSSNISPELRWTGVPPGTQSFALVLFDLTFGQAHWALWNIPADATLLAANVSKDTATPPAPAGSRQANANFASAGGDGYFGPHLPCNVFELQLYALSLATFSPADPESSVLVAIELQELGAPVLAIAKLAGRVDDETALCE
jgi:phosphatidylethanolamine-binding protein (PEBP) family uncharacterized protein